MPERLAAGTALGPPSISPIRTRRRWRATPAQPQPGLIEKLENRLFLSASPAGSGAFHHHHPTSQGAHTSPVFNAPAPTTPAQPAPQSAATTATSIATLISEASAAGAVTAAPAAATVTNPIAGDANSDGIVNLADLQLILPNYNKILTGATWAQGDFNGDGAVNYQDLVLLAANWGKTGGTPIISSTGAIMPAASQPPTNLTWSGPLVITQGGTYTGNWQSTAAGTAAVQIQTTQPVTIVNSNIQSRGNLIETDIDHASVTIKNTHGWALNPNLSGQSPGRFLNAEKFNSLDIENNTMVGTAGIEMGYYEGNGTASQTVKVLKNNALNIDGRWSDGNGGFQTGASDNDLVQFAQFNQCFNMVGAEIAWNQVINQPGLSRPEDNVSVFESSGTTASPILIHDNYIQGAYPADPANDTSYSGGGIMLSDGTTGSAATATGDVQAYNNIIISTTNYGMAISSGHNDSIYNNTIISSGLLPSGQKIVSENVGIYVWNNVNDPNWANDTEYGNTIGWMGPSGRNDKWIPNSANSGTDIALPGTITLAVEQSYYNVWATKVAASGYIIGAQ